MIKEKMSELLSDFDPEVGHVVAQVIEEEYRRLDTKSPRGIKDEVRKIIEQVEVERKSRRSGRTS